MSKKARGGGFCETVETEATTLDADLVEDADRLQDGRTLRDLVAGNEPIEACEQRVREIREWKCIPVVQRRRPLDYTGGPLPTIHDWTERKFIDFQRWGNRLSHSLPWSRYNPKLNHSGVKARKAP